MKRTPSLVSESGTRPRGCVLAWALAEIHETHRHRHHFGVYLAPVCLPKPRRVSSPGPSSRRQSASASSSIHWRRKRTDQQAFAELLGNYGEFVGAIAVVATLVFLPLQIKGSNRLARFDSHVRARAFVGEYQKLMVNPEINRVWIRGLVDPAALQRWWGQARMTYAELFREYVDK